MARGADGPLASHSEGAASVAAMTDLELPDWEATWPQRRERRPRFVDPHYLHYSALVASLAARAL